jgi:integrase
MIRRSHTVGKATMECTKQGTQYPISLPQEILDIIRWQINMIPKWHGETDLLFPGKNGFMSATYLPELFAKIERRAGLAKHITPRCMRRTFQDLARVASISDVVTRSISGHATEQMQQHYSTVHDDEQRRGLAKIIELAGVRTKDVRINVCV